MMKYTGKIVLVLLIMLFVQYHLHGQPPPPPGNHGSEHSEKPFHQQSPIGGGLLVLSVMAAVYGSRKYLKSRKHHNP